MHESYAHKFPHLGNFAAENSDNIKIVDLDQAVALTDLSIEARASMMYFDVARMIRSYVLPGKTYPLSFVSGFYKGYFNDEIESIGSDRQIYKYISSVLEPYEDLMEISKLYEDKTFKLNRNDFLDGFNNLYEKLKTP